jgi:hypothetical protein
MGAALLLAKLLGQNVPSARLGLPALAIVAWLAVTGLNMWVGVTRAGYSAKEELPIFLLLFLVPTITVLVARRWIH